MNRYSKTLLRKGALPPGIMRSRASCDLKSSERPAPPPDPADELHALLEGLRGTHAGRDPRETAPARPAERARHPGGRQAQDAAAI